MMASSNYKWINQEQPRFLFRLTISFQIYIDHHLRHPRALCNSRTFAPRLISAILKGNPILRFSANLFSNSMAICVTKFDDLVLVFLNFFLINLRFFWSYFIFFM